MAFDFFKADTPSLDSAYHDAFQGTVLKANSQQAWAEALRASLDKARALKFAQDEANRKEQLARDLAMQQEAGLDKREVMKQAGETQRNQNYYNVQEDILKRKEAADNRALMASDAFAGLVTGQAPQSQQFDVRGLMQALGAQGEPGPGEGQSALTEQQQLAMMTPIQQKQLLDYRMAQHKMTTGEATTEAKLQEQAKKQEADAALKLRQQEHKEKMDLLNASMKQLALRDNAEAKKKSTYEKAVELLGKMKLKATASETSADFEARQKRTLDEIIKTLEESHIGADGNLKPANGEQAAPSVPNKTDAAKKAKALLDSGDKAGAIKALEDAGIDLDNETDPEILKLFGG